MINSKSVALNLFDIAIPLNLIPPHIVIFLYTAMW